jgi:hypothetical protein
MEARAELERCPWWRTTRTSSTPWRDRQEKLFHPRSKAEPASQGTLERDAGASERSDHPFHELLPDALELERLPRVADYRNKAGGHASGEKAEQSLVLDYVNFAIQWMALFNRWY